MGCITVKPEENNQYSAMHLIKTCVIELKIGWNKLFSFRFQRKANCSSHVRRASYMNALPVRFNDMLADSQAKACAATVTATACIGAVKALKNAWQMLLIDANAVIAYFHQHMLFICFVYACHNGTACPAIFTCILNNIDQHHPDFFLISKNSNW